MANHKSVAKRARQSEKRRKRNLSVKKALRTLEKGQRKAIEGKSLNDATVGFRQFMKKMSKATQKGLIHKNKASRKISQMACKLHKLEKKS